MGNVRGLFYGIISSSTFGLIPLFVLPVLAGGMGVDSIMFYRFGISSVVLGMCLGIKRHNLRISIREAGILTVLGIFYAMTSILLTSSYQYIPSGIATTIHFLYPVVVTAVMILFFKDKVSFPIILATVLAITGIYFLSKTGGSGSVSLKGLLLVLTTVVTYAMYIVGVNKSGVRGMDGLKMTFYVLSIGAFIFGLNLLFKGERLEMITDWNTGFCLLMLALIPTLISDFTLILSVQYLGSTKTAVLGCMEPLTAVCMGVLFLNESLGIWQVGGIATIVLAVSVVILASSKEHLNVKRFIPLKIRRLGKKAA